MRFLFLVACLLGTSPLLVNRAMATESGLRVAPVFQDVSIEADQVETEFLVTLSNDTSESLMLRPSVVDFGSLDESGGVAFLGANDNLVHKYALASWMYLEKDILSLAAGESEQLRVVIRNHESLSPGGHYGAVLFRVSSDESLPTTESSRVAVNQIVSVLVFAKKQGGEILSLKLLDTGFKQNIFFGLDDASIMFRNEGNVHLAPRGIVTVEDPFGRLVQKGTINPESSRILPETQRIFLTQLSTTRELVIPGRYLLTVNYRYDGKDTFEKTQVSILLLPWRSMVILSFIGVIVIIWRKMRRKKEHPKK